MKTKTVETIVSNEEHVRLRIYDGELPADEAVKELLRIEVAQHGETKRRLMQAYDEIRALQGNPQYAAA